ncbi:tetratricopeptide repeat protein [Kitasatospora sp. NPDC059673]|uniref:tetratricopeptide repeat protein n=1 Tax=Kitasatospora sp. NPDC059673 TaxID=3346901 RepID=UPI0036D18370
MAATRTSGPRPATVPNQAMRELRGDLSPREFATLVRRAAREIGEHVSCDARYVGRVEAGEIRCPNYAYQRVFRHMWPGKSLADLGFAPRKAVRRRPRTADPNPDPHTAPNTAPNTDPNADPNADPHTTPNTTPNTAPNADPPIGPTTEPTSHPAACPTAQPLTDPPSDPAAGPAAPVGPPDASHRPDEEDDVLRRTFLNGCPAAVATALGVNGSPQPAPTPPTLPIAPPPEERRRVGAAEVRGVEQAVRDIRLLDDVQGADALFELAGQSLRSAYVLLNDGAYNTETERRLQCGAGELAISVGWLAHDSNRLMEARSFYSEALATARMAQDTNLEAHVFSNIAFLARDSGQARESLRAAQAGQAAAVGLGSERLRSLLTLREASAWALLGDRGACHQALSRAYALFDRGPRDADPEWMSFFGEAELAGQEAQCWSVLGEFERASVRAEQAVDLQHPHFVRNRALYIAELAHDRLGRGDLAGAAVQGAEAVAMLGQVRSARIRGMLAHTADRLRGHSSVAEVREFLEGYDSTVAA